VGLLKCLVSETDNSQRVTLEPAQLIEPGKEETIIDVYRTLQEDLTIPFEHRRYTMVKLSLPKIVGVATFSEEERER